MKKQINIAVIGLGARGGDLLKNIYLPMSKEYGDIHVKAVCDVYDDRAAWGADRCEKDGCPRPFATTDYREILAKKDELELDAFLITCAWEPHLEIAIAAMRAGLDVGVEVGGAYSLDDCWRLVHTHEETGKHCMLLENCCYGERELMVLNMVRQGVFGDIVHCEGGYQHDLRGEIMNGKEGRHYRLRNYMNRNCENYPTHELGPIAKVLDINNGNRMVTLNSFSTASKGLRQAILRERKEGDPLRDVEFKQGDIVTTVIKCQQGQTIILKLDTTLPRPYSRSFTVRGTIGSYFEDNDSVYIDDQHDEFHWGGSGIWGNAKQFEAEYNHPLWKNYEVRGGHGGMDWLVNEAFFEALRKGSRPPIDTYDTASLMCVSTLSEQSIALGGATVYIPDFTNGRWYKRDDIDGELTFNLDKIEPFADIYQNK